MGKKERGEGKNGKAGKRKEGKRDADAEDAMQIGEPGGWDEGGEEDCGLDVACQAHLEP